MGCTEQAILNTIGGHLTFLKSDDIPKVNFTISRRVFGKAAQIQLERN